jgi:DNA-binding MarR family transcriptional regulator
MNKDILKRIGLTEGESKVYLALLKLGQTTTGPIVKKSGVTTSKSYKILDRLEEKGLASYVYKNKIKHFKAASPTKVLDLITKQYEDLEKKKKEVEKIIPELLAYQKQIQEEHEAEIYHGLEGLDTVFTEQLKIMKKKDINHVIGLTHFQEYPKPIALFFKQLQKKRDKAGFKNLFLMGEHARGSFDYLEKSKTSEIKHLPFASLVAINIYKNITVIGIFIGKPILFKIKSQEVANNFIEYFKMLWKSARN